MLEINQLTFSRGERTLCDGLDLTLHDGEWCALTGANGAGKTTLLRILCGLSAPERGAFRWRGLTPARDRERYCEQTLYLGHRHGLRDELTVAENLAFYRGLGRGGGREGMHGRERGDGAIADAAAAFGVAEWLHTPCAKLSQGQLRRAALSRLLVERASLWLLDEPGVGLDRGGVELLERRLARHLEGGGAAVIATHGVLRPPGHAAARDVRLGAAPHASPGAHD